MNGFLLRQRHLLAPALLMLVTLAVYWPVGGHDFISFDDPDYVTRNKQVQRGLTAEGLRWAFITDHTGNWHPLTWLSHMTDVQIFGVAPGRHHLVSLFIHALNAALLFVLLWRMTGAFWRSVFVAALFALHPQRVESVAWVSERKDVLCAFFGFLAILAYSQYVKKSSIAAYGALLLLFTASLMSKPMLVTLPFVLLLLDFWPLGRRPTGEAQDQGRRTAHQRTIPGLIVEKIPLFAVAAIFSTVILFMQQRGGNIASLEHLSFALRTQNALVSYMRYMGKMIWPFSLAPFYHFPSGGHPWWMAGLAVLVLIGFTAGALLLLRRRPYVATGWFWYLGTLVPVIGLVQVGMQSMADRYTYVPLIGLSIIISWGGYELFQKIPRSSVASALCAGAVILGLAVLTRSQTGYWQNGVRLFEHAVEVEPDSYRAYYSLGSSYSWYRRYGEALQAYEKAVHLKPNYYDAHINLGNVYVELGIYRKGTEEYRKALLINPDDINAYNNLGSTYLDQGKFRDAIDILERALEISASYPEVYFNLGSSYGGLGMYREGIGAFQEALALRPDYVQALNSIGTAYERMQLNPEAIGSYEKAIGLDPGYVEARYNLGVLYSRTGNINSALNQYNALRPLSAEAAARLYKFIEFSRN